MATKIIGGGPHMPSFIVGLILGVFLTLAYQHFMVKPSETTEQKVIDSIPAGALKVAPPQ